MANKWTWREDALVRNLYRNRGAIRYLKYFLPERTEIAIKARIKYLKKKDNIYNEDHVGDKYKENEDFFNILSPNSILDLMAGKNRFWHTLVNNSNRKNTCLVLDNDIGNYGTTFSSDANNLLELFLRHGNTRFDLIDLDPFGIPTRDQVINSSKLVNKGLSIGIGGFIRTKTLIKTKNPYFFEERFGIEKDIELINAKDLYLGILNLINKETDGKFRVHRVIEYKNYHRLFFKRGN